MFTKQDADELIIRLRRVKQDNRISFEQIQNQSDISERTLKRLINSKEEQKPRTETLNKIATFLRQFEDERVYLGISERAFSSYIAATMGIDQSRWREAIEKCKGSYQCIRYSALCEGVISSYMYIEKPENEPPKFKHIEKVRDNSNVFGDAPHRELCHEGTVLAQDDKLYFPSVHKRNLRLLTAVRSRNTDERTLSGMLLTVDARWHHPFSARVILRYLGEKDCFEEHENLFGYFPPGSAQFVPLAEHIENQSMPQRVLFAKQLGVIE